MAAAASSRSYEVRTPSPTHSSDDVVCWGFPSMCVTAASAVKAATVSGAASGTATKIQFTFTDPSTRKRVTASLDRRRGRGASGTVYGTSQPGVVVKHMSFRSQCKYVKHECDMLSDLGQLVGVGIVPKPEEGRAEVTPGYYLAMRDQGRQDLHAWVNNRAESEYSPLTAIRWLEKMISALDAVAELHAKGYLHRDIKDSNLVVGLGGKVNLVDWALAGRIVDFRDESSVVGTLLFLPPHSSDSMEKLIKRRTQDSIVSTAVKGSVEIVEKATFKLKKYAEGDYQFLARCRRLHGEKVFDCYYASSQETGKQAFRYSPNTDQYSLSMTMWFTFQIQFKDNPDVIARFAALFDCLASLCDPSKPASLPALRRVLIASQRHILSTGEVPNNPVYYQHVVSPPRADRMAIAKRLVSVAVAGVAIGSLLQVPAAISLIGLSAALASPIGCAVIGVGVVLAVVALAYLHAMRQPRPMLASPLRRGRGCWFPFAGKAIEEQKPLMPMESASLVDLGLCA